MNLRSFAKKLSEATCPKKIWKKKQRIKLLRPENGGPINRVIQEVQFKEDADADADADDDDDDDHHHHHHHYHHHHHLMIVFLP